MKYSMESFLTSKNITKMRTKYHTKKGLENWRILVLLSFLFSFLIPDADAKTYAKFNGSDPTTTTILDLETIDREFVDPNMTNTLKNNISNPDRTPKLDINSSERKVLVPKVTRTQKDNIINPTNGFLVFDKATSSFWMYNSSTSSWHELNTDEETISLTCNDINISGKNSIDFTANKTKANLFTNATFVTGKTKFNDELLLSSIFLFILLVPLCKEHIMHII